MGFSSSLLSRQTAPLSFSSALWSPPSGSHSQPIQFTVSAPRRQSSLHRQQYKTTATPRTTSIYYKPLASLSVTEKARSPTYLLYISSPLSPLSIHSFSLFSPTITDTSPINSPSIATIVLSHFLIYLNILVVPT